MREPVRFEREIALLTESEAHEFDDDRAVRQNRRLMQKLGWQSYIRTITRLIGLHGFPSTFPLSPVEEKRFAEAVSNWQRRQKPKLSDDGIIGPITWSRMLSALSSKPLNGSDLEIIPREEWGARHPHKRYGFVKTPVRFVFIHHTTGNTPPPDAKRKEDAKRIKRVQNFHMDEKKWADIAYSFLCLRSGRLAVGRGWGRVGAHTACYNSRAYGICLVGNYSQIQPTEAQIKAICRLIRAGKDMGFIANNAKIYPHEKVANKDCPGKNVMAVLDRIRQLAA